MAHHHAQSQSAMFAGHLLDPSSAEHLKARTTSWDFTAAAALERSASPAPRNREPRKLVLCFDGTGNKFHGDESDSNILKIFRMLDRTADDQYHYYQPGIGTYVVSASLSHTSLRARLKSWYQKAKDSAIGSSFDQHVVGGYRFLMRFYSPGDEIYMFGFSRGAYIARFLAEMIDYIGLLSHGNEEMVSFAWKAFSQWQCRPGATGNEKLHKAEHEKTHEMYHFMKGFRETFSRPVGRIRFLGLFDTVNSVPRFETAWMQRSKFPYTARSTAKVIRHAVSIDERRAKFRQDLMYQQHHHHHRRKRRHIQEHLENMLNLVRDGESEVVPPEPETVDGDNRGRRPSQHLAPVQDDETTDAGNPQIQVQEYAPYRARSRSRQPGRRSSRAHCDGISEHSQLGDDDDDDDDSEQDIDEVWFAGGHGDIGGGWQKEDTRRNASHVPLVWIVREAMKAGLSFDMDKVREMDCLDVYADYSTVKSDTVEMKQTKGPDIRLNEGTAGEGEPVEPPSPDEDDDESGFTFQDLMQETHLARIHDSLEYGGGLGTIAVTAWNIMEWMPFRRMDLQEDGSWRPIRWPLPRGEVRDVPDDVRVHGSVIRRMKKDATYRPGNLIVGGGGRGVRMAPPAYGIGHWVCAAEEGDPIGEVWKRSGKPVKLETNGKKKKKGKESKTAAVMVTNGKERVD